MQKEYITKSFFHALGVLLYVSGVALLLTNAKSILGDQPKPFFIPVFMLLLLIISATITGLLVLGKPAFLYFNGFKKEAIMFLGTTLLWLFLFLIAVGIIISRL